MTESSGKLIRKYFDFSGAPVLAIGLITLFLLESKHALRKRKVSGAKRLKTNIAIASAAAVVLRLVLIPALVDLSIYSKKKNLGFLRFLKLPAGISSLIGFLILDYGNYRWHKLNHEIPWLWKLHQVHHADLDLDVSTALRFHAGEVLASVFYRGMWITIAGISPQTVLTYEILFEAATNFHHSNIDLSEKTDKVLSHFIVTPRMHGIHHSIVKQETDSNFCIVLTAWDRIHKTLKLDIPQEEINIGVPYIREHLGFKELMKMPLFQQQEWQLPSGQVPQRIH